MGKITRKEKMEDRNWDDLTKEQKKELTDFADSIGIPPNFVWQMYEANQIEVPSNAT